MGQLILAAFCWSLGGLLIKSIGWPALAISGGRGLIAAVFLTLTTRPLKFNFSRWQLLGAIGYTVCTVCFCVATKLTTAANAIFLQYTSPVWAALLGSWLLGERTTRWDWITIGAVFAGMALFFGDSLEVSHVIGNIFAVLSGVGFAWMSVALRKQKHGSTVESIILGNALGFAIGFRWILQAPALSPNGWMLLLILGIVQLGFPYLLFALAIKEVTALESLLIPIMEPILNPLWVMLAIGERPGRLAIAGGAIVLSAATLRAAAAIRSRPDIPALPLAS